MHPVRHVSCGTRPRSNHSHISNMRLDQFRHLLSRHPFTVFVSGADHMTIPIGMVDVRFLLLITDHLHTSCGFRHHVS